MASSRDNPTQNTTTPTPIIGLNRTRNAEIITRIPSVIVQPAPLIPTPIISLATPTAMNPRKRSQKPSTNGRIVKSIDGVHSSRIPSRISPMRVYMIAGSDCSSVEIPWKILPRSNRSMVQLV